MTLTLTLRETPAVPLEVSMLSPDRLAQMGRREIQSLEVWHGNRRSRMGDFFAVSGQGGEDLRVEGDLTRVKFVGADMNGGRLVVSGSVGMHAGARMRDGQIVIEGDAGDWAGAEMRGGVLEVRGSAGRRLGAAYPGRRAGMRGGEIVVRSGVGEEAGAGMRRGLVAIGGRAGAYAGLRMLAGTIAAFGGMGDNPGAGMRRGSIVSMGPTTPLPTFLFSCSYHPPFLDLCLRRLRVLGLEVSDEQLAGSYARWSGDALELRRGELLIMESQT